MFEWKRVVDESQPTFAVNRIGNLLFFNLQPPFPRHDLVGVEPRVAPTVRVQGPLAFFKRLVDRVARPVTGIQRLVVPPSGPAARRVPLTARGYR